MEMENRDLVEPQRCLCRELVSHCWSDAQDLSRTMTWQGDLAEYVVIPQVKVTVQSLRCLRTSPQLGYRELIKQEYIHLRKNRFKLTTHFV